MTLRPLTVLVGENNQGKSSLLKMLERVLLLPISFWDNGRLLSEDEFDFWYPANDTQHKARRLTLMIGFLDGRVARSYSAMKGDEIALRIAVGSSDRLCRLNLGAPRRGETHDLKAEELFRRLQREIEVVLIPPMRDGKSSEFAAKATRAVNDSIRSKINHRRQAGAPKEYRLAKEIISKITKIVSLNSAGLTYAADSPLSSMLRGSEVRVDMYPQDIARIIEKTLFVYLSTGSHDLLKVLPREVGNGLQSLIDINLTIDAANHLENTRTSIVIVEEPEAFLHPSAQRQFMQFLRRVMSPRMQSVVITTHSPVIVDESIYGEITIVRNQRHYEPLKCDPVRAAINTTLLTSNSAEILFASTVVFVEGESDRIFFNTLLRRIRARVTTPELSGIVFQPTGSCTFFAPWLKLAKSYARAGEQPFEALWIMDGDAASSSNGHRAVLGLATDCGFQLTAAEHSEVLAFGNLAWDKPLRSPTSNAGANSALRSRGGFLFSCDLEWAIVNGGNSANLRIVKRALTGTNISRTGNDITLARRLGSKIASGTVSSNSSKHPYLRGLIAEQLDLGSLPPEIYTALLHILFPCFRTPAALTSALRIGGIASA